MIAHSVSLRTREFGVRMTLGASGSHIMGLVFRRGMFELVLGLLIGLPGAFAATRVLETMLIGVEPADPVTFLVSTAVLVLAGSTRMRGAGPPRDRCRSGHRSAAELNASEPARQNRV